MIPFPIRFLIGVAGGLLSATALPAANTSAVAPAPAPLVSRAAARSERISQQIDALLKHRLKPDPLPVVLPNPFEVVSGATVRRSDAITPDPRADAGAEKSAGSPAASPPEATPASNAELLTRIAPTLKIGGMIQQKDQAVQIVVNGAPRKEGDFIAVKLGEASARLQLVRVAPGAIVVRLDDAELTVRF